MSDVQQAPRWELVRCTNLGCGHEHVRPCNGRRALPCTECRCEMLVLPLRIVLDGAERAVASIDIERALRWGISACRTLGRRALTSTERAHFLGAEQAYSESLAMLLAAELTGSDPAAHDRGAGVVIARSFAEARRAYMSVSGTDGYYIRNSRTKEVLDGPYREHGSAQLEASALNRARRRADPFAEPLEVVLLGRDRVWP